ncbi:MULTISPECIES: hypothetical protein [Cohnella]|uniref:hypothetical protein n=1 Tax=Cohnella TaxID=329857 RepID=UPI0009BA456B|nr:MULTISPECIES: hypothetical protein [Cohnella]MBN2984463.1 hypothetical protein [Cohnella algarum]
MRKRFGPIHFFLLALMLIGLTSWLLNGLNSRQLLTPLIIVAIVFLLYKFPPSRWSSKRSEKARYREAAMRSQRRHASRPTGKTKRKSFPFKVIEGSKNRDDEPRPPYH